LIPGVQPRSGSKEAAYPPAIQHSYDLMGFHMIYNNLMSWNLANGIYRLVINSHGKWPIIDDSPIQNLSGDFPKLG
jgi:hypothetical protein